MSREDLVHDILSRFRMSRAILKNMHAYEFELIYETYPKLTKKFINDSIYQYNNKEFEVEKTQKTPDYKREQYRGVLNTRLLLS